VLKVNTPPPPPLLPRHHYHPAAASAPTSGPASAASPPPFPASTSDVLTRLKVTYDELLSNFAINQHAPLHSVNFTKEMTPAPMPTYDDIRWQTVKVNVPTDATDLHLTFADAARVGWCRLTQDRTRIARRLNQDCPQVEHGLTAG